MDVTIAFARRFLLASLYLTCFCGSPSFSAAAAAARLFLPTNGVALSQFPSYNRLSRSVPVNLTVSHSAVSWIATSNQSWLTVTPSGMTGQLITLTATPGTLSQNTAHIGLVTVTTSDLGPAPVTAMIRVSLWIGPTDPQMVTFTQQTAALAANPVEPWVYVSPGNPAISSPSIEVFNVYTGALVATFNQVAPTVGHMVVSPDGYRLFAVDTTNYTIIELNASTGAVIASFALDGPIASDFSFAYARPNGAATLFAPGEPAIEVATGASISTPISIGIPLYDPFIAVTADGSRLAIVERGIDPATLYPFNVSGTRGQLMITARKAKTTKAGGCQALAFSSDGSQLYLACTESPYGFDVYDWTTRQQIQTLSAVPNPNNAIFDSLGDFVGGVTGFDQTDDVFVFDTQGDLLGALPTTTFSYSQGQGSNLLVTSGDSIRVVAATTPSDYTSQTLIFRNLP